MEFLIGDRPSRTNGVLKTDIENKRRESKTEEEGIKPRHSSKKVSFDENSIKNTHELTEKDIMN